VAVGYCTHHFDVRVGDKENACRAEWGCGLRFDAFGRGVKEGILDGMTWKIRREMRFPENQRKIFVGRTLQLDLLLVPRHRGEYRI
jgi:hypothetical protein